MLRILIMPVIILKSIIGIHAQERFARIYDQGDWWAGLIINVIPHDLIFCFRLVVS